MRRRNRALGLLGVLLVVGCGDVDRELVGYSSDPPADVGQVSLPDLSDGGRPFSMRAESGHVLVVYFGYTNCPDFCPTTMSDLRIARRKLDQPERVDVAMVTVDPERDLPVLDDYVSSFFDDGHALGTLDADELVGAASAFGVSSSITTHGEHEGDGEAEVAHTTYLYAIDDQGLLVLTWPFGVTPDDYAADLEQLLQGSER